MDSIYFTLNGEKYTVADSEVTADTSLNDFLRYSLNLNGTKAMCHEGGCGACIVAVSQIHPATKQKHMFAVNSCLVNILSCHKWVITTIEGVGNRKDGYHTLQHRLAAFNGTQCGYCTPGWVMNMYSLYEESAKKLTLKEVENSFGGNICRCTGYRPILDAFKSYASDVGVNTMQDLEDLDKSKCLKKCVRRCSVITNEWIVLEDDKEEYLDLNVSGNKWYKAYKIEDVFKVLSREGTDSYRLIAGNTGKGVYQIRNLPRVQIDISSISSLRESSSDVNLILGAGMSLTEVMQEFRDWAKRSSDFIYLEHFYRHLDLVASVPVRNIGTIGGNLALKNSHHEFPSDVFLLLETVGATVTLVDNKLSEVQLQMEDFLKTDLRNKIIKNVKLPPLSHINDFIRTYKIMPRAQNAFAIVNAGFSLRIKDGKVLSSTLTYGSISPEFIRAYKTENVLKGRELFNEQTLSRALSTLSEELAPIESPPDSSPFCRKNIALGLFYKAILSLSSKVNPRYVSGGSILERDISRGAQSFDTDKSLWPLNQPIPKLEALTQCSGEVRYSCEVPSTPRDVHVAFVLSNICVGDIVSFDASDALKIPGVIAFITAKEIPGKNNFTPLDVPWMTLEEEILASKKVSYYGQPVGMIAAKSHKLAVAAADTVKVVYKKSEAKPVLSIGDVLLAPDKDKRIREDKTIKATNKGDDTTQVIKGSYTVPGQYHFTMETQSCTVSNTELGVSVRSATQWPDLVHVAVAQCLGIDENRVELTVPRLGGGYGGKASRSGLVACACAIVASTLGRTATMVLPLAHNTAAIGKRAPCQADYEIGINNDGLIQYLNLKYYADCGYNYNDSIASNVADSIIGPYESSRWNITGYSVLTDKASNTWCRAPATAEGTAIIEHIMERIAYAINKDGVDIRKLNLSPKHASLVDLIDSFKIDSNYEERKVEIKAFNDANAWKKRAMKLSIMSFPIEYAGNYPVTISVYHADGSIAISHGGVEMGQGINTKVAQVCAYTLRVPLEKITVRGTDNFTSPNSMASNGSITSELVAYATVKACNILMERLKMVKSEKEEPWEVLIARAYDKGINLQSSYMTSPNDNLEGYDIYGTCATEVELDVLTGTHVVLRVDILEDTGVSLSPDIDVGQIEGAFIMGLGLWTCENLVYDKSSGRLLTDRTGTYRPPGAKDIPVDFRINFKRNSVNPAGVLRSKATGEPALVLAVSVALSLQEAVLQARKEFGYTADWIALDNPCTVENILKAISPKIEYYKLN